MRFLFLILVSIVFVISGCSEQQKEASSQEQIKPVVEMVDNTQLAKVILRPKQKELVIAKDPFKPIMSKNANYIAGTQNMPSDLAGGKSAAEDVILIGVVKFGEDYRAFIKTDEKSGVYKTGDKIGLYTILKIEIDRIELRDQDNQIIVKVRGKNESE